MRHLFGVIVSLFVAAAFVASAMVAAQARQIGDATITIITPAEKKAEAAKKDETKQAPAKQKAVQAKAVQIIGVLNAGPAVPPGEPNPQVLQQYRPMLWAEYHLACSVCDLSVEQRKAIARDAEQVLQNAVAKAGMGMGVVINRRGAGMEPIARNEPEATIREGLMKAVKNHLNPEQATRYQGELDRRVAHRRRITVDNIVAKIDESLILTVEQRDTIRASLVSNWEESWCPSPESLLFNSQMLPQIPDRFIVPALNEPQKSIWRGLHKYAGANFRIVGFMANNMANGGDSPEDDTLREAREAETRARAESRARREAEEKGKNEAEAKKEPAKKR